MSKIAITGTIASGKTSVSLYLRDLGFYVFDCDKYNSFLLEKGNEGYFKIKKKYSCFFDDDVLDKKKFANAIFSNRDIKNDVESILHPIIKNKMIEESKIHSLFFAEVPLLFETDFYKEFDHKWLVVSDDEICIKRLLEKGYTKQEAIARINNQMSVEEKKKLATKILYNNKDFTFLNNQVDEALKHVR